MKGVIFNILEEFIISHSSEQVYEEIFAMCPLHSRDGFVAPGTYPDSDLNSIVAAACDRLGMEPNNAIMLFGEFLFTGLAQRYPQFLADRSDPLEFLSTVNDVIHVEVCKLMQGTNLPQIECYRHDDGSMTVHYRSKRQLCLLLHGLLIGVGKHFSVEFSISENQCMHDGADFCQFSVLVNETHAQLA